MMPINHHLDPLERSGIRVFTNLAKATPDCRMLTIGEPDQATPEPIRQAALEALSRGETHYAPNQGTASLRSAIAAFETNRGRPTAPEEVLVTVGATQALYTALTGILNPGDQVIIRLLPVCHHCHGGRSRAGLSGCEQNGLPDYGGSPECLPDGEDKGHRPQFPLQSHGGHFEGEQPGYRRPGGAGKRNLPDL